MSRPIIAVDVDDVLAEFVPAFCKYAKEKWDEDVTTENFTEEWFKIFKVKDLAIIKQRATQMFGDADFYNNMLPIAGAKEVIVKLSTQYELVPLTSRTANLRDLTLAWLNRNYGEVFEEIFFSGAYDSDKDFRKTVHLTKGDICQEIGASYLIDDQPKHVNSATDCEIDGLLFGDYSWNRNEPIAGKVKRVDNWTAVEQYFDGMAKTI